MASRLASVPVLARRRSAAMLALFAALFIAVGVLAIAGNVHWFVKVLGGFVLFGALALALMVWGLLNSIRVDRIAAELDAEIAAAIAEHDATCNCGGSHADGHGTGGHGSGACAGEGSGAGCAHDCAACQFTASAQAASSPASTQVASSPASSQGN